MQAPTVSELVKDPTVLQALEDAWHDSLPNDKQLRHEEGGWVYSDTATGTNTIRLAAAGKQADLHLDFPPLIVGSVIVATFHTHPNPTSEGWETGPSSDDMHSAWALGVPCLIRAEDGLHVTGPPSRHGGLAGEPGFPH
jgi:hypothetical protein